MRVAQKVAGYTLAEADNLRKACGKKDRKLIAKVVIPDATFMFLASKSHRGRILAALRQCDLIT